MRYLFTAVLIVVLALATEVRAQGVQFRARLKEGDTLRYDFKAAFTAARGESKDPDRLEQEGRLRMTVASVDRDGNATVRVAFESLEASLHGGGKDQAYKSGDHPAEGNESALGAVYAELATSILELQVSPEGSIGEVSGLEGALRAAAGAKTARPERVLGALSPAAIGATLSPIFALDENGRTRRQGDSWTTGRDLEVVHPYTARVNARYTLSSLSEGVADLKGPITTTLHSGRKPDAGPVLDITEQSGLVTAQWDSRASRLMSRTAEQKIAWRATLALKEPMETTSTTTSRLELKAVTGP